MMMMMKKKKERKKCIGILKCPGSFDYGVMFSSILEKHQFATKIFDCEAGELPSRHEDFDGFIITGSSASAYDDVDWVKGLISKTRELIEKKCRVVGICFGHQVVAQAFCPGEVTKNPNGWELGMCSFTLEDHAAKYLSNVTSMNDDEPLMKSLSLLCVHADCVRSVPKGFRSIGGNANTSIQGMLSLDRNVLTFQSHPEFNRRAVRECALSIVKKYGPITTFSMDVFNSRISDHLDSTFVRAAIVGHFMREEEGLNYDWS